MRKRSYILTCAFCLLTAILMPTIVTRAAPGNGEGTSTFSMDWFSMDGGGSTSTDGTFTIASAIGQIDTATLSDGDFTLRGGYLAPSFSQTIFSDGFESGDLSKWTAVTGN